MGAVTVFSKKQYQRKASYDVSGSYGDLFSIFVCFFISEDYVALNDGMTENK
jgi:hypothetical protein